MLWSGFINGIKTKGTLGLRKLFFTFPASRLESFGFFLKTFRFFVKMKKKIKGFAKDFIDSPEFNNVKTSFTGFNFGNIRLGLAQAHSNLKLSKVCIFSGSD